MDGLLLRANRTIKVSNKVHHPFKSPKYPALAFKRPNGLFDYRLDYVLRPKEDLPTSFEDKEINASIGIIHLFPSIPISQVEAQLNDSNVQGIIIIGKFKVHIIYSEKATKFCEISTLLLTGTTLRCQLNE